MKRAWISIGYLVSLLFLAGPQGARAQTHLEAVSTPSRGIVTIRFDGPFRAVGFTLSDPDRQVYDFENVLVSSSGDLDIETDDTFGAETAAIQKVRWAQYLSGEVPVARVVLDLSGPTEVNLVQEASQLMFSIPGESLPSSFRNIYEGPSVATESSNERFVAPSPPLILVTEPLGYDVIALEPLLGPLTEATVRVADGPPPEQSTVTESLEVIKASGPTTPDSEKPEGGVPQVAPTRLAQDREASKREIVSTRTNLGPTDFSPGEPTEASFSEGTASNWLVRTDGKRIALQEPWRIEGRRVIYTTRAGVLASMRLSDVNLAASREGP